ncbi:acid phosphatase type 7-like [Hyposmocoma kahamanoa]|uniref:acid phosphatase type 7-like n=1 Tax=Hyposmocoma kahamanoa TaxID=1477025 RepID=UPI000E6D9A70|nr:acid phosphatase type 7-like [Hyposmocoma kahamanoa]
MKYLLVICSLTSVVTNQLHIGDADPDYICSYCQPEQIHIAFGEKSNNIVVTWTTADDAKESRVQFGVFTTPLDKEAVGNHVCYPNIRKQWIHRVTLENLRFNTTYGYRCGSRFAWSELFYFTTPPEEESVLRAVIYGDMGVENAHALPYLQQEAENSSLNFILHVGDFAYDMYEQNSKIGDQFMRQIQPMAAIVPYMVCPGNHEVDRNFTQYKNRMTMPRYQEWESMFYSWDIGPIHFVSINSEAYYFLNFGIDPLVNQFRWLVNDLEQANSEANRKMRPWIILYGHRPMYCTGGNNDDKAECPYEHTRIGLNVTGNKEKFAIEPLLMKYGVDIVIWAHEHMYERAWPLYDYKVYNGSTEYPYVNPRAPVHIITGSAGCREETDHFGEMAEWCAFRSRDYGYTRFHAHNKTHVYFEQISVDLKGEVIDSFWLVQNHHGPFEINRESIYEAKRG